MKRMHSGGLIQREREIEFYYNGKKITAFEGDTLASALLAAGEKVLARSFKYHRPRGVMSAGIEESNALLTLGEGPRRTPNIPATQVLVEANMHVYSQNAWPSVHLDWRAINQWFSPLLVAGFYYKTFMGPLKDTRAWMFFERHIRKAAGLGRVSAEQDTARYDVQHDFFDCVVVGGGLSGIQAAIQAAEKGQDVALIEQSAWLGGRHLNTRVASEPYQQLQQSLKVLDDWVEKGAIALLLRTSVFGVYDSKSLGAIQQHSFFADPAAGQPYQRLRIIRYSQLTLACGALERPLVFAGNDRPGVMLASAVLTYLRQYALLLGERLLLCTQNDAAYECAFAMAEAGAHVEVADLRSALDDTLLEKALDLGVTVHLQTALVEAKGARSVHAAVLADYDPVEQRVLHTTRSIDVDLIAVSGGFSPTIHLSTHLGHKPAFSENYHCYVPSPDLPKSIRCVGRMTGAGLPRSTSVPPLVDRQRRDKVFLDFQHDVQLQDIDLAQREGYQHVELTKRYTTLGMATDQGKTSNVQTLEYVARQRNLTVPEVGTTTFRPPFLPVSVGAFAGRAVGSHYRPVRRTPIEAWHQANQAVWIEAGPWRRANWYRQNGVDILSAYKQEMRFVRQGTALADVSTLGKIDVQGPDAGVFLDRVYTNNFSQLPVGKARYGLMLREDGIVLDDGTSSRIADNHYFLTTTTGQAARVMSHMEWLLQGVWPHLRVTLSSSSDQWATFSLAGVNSRDVLKAAFEDLDVSPDNLPHMGWIEGEYQGVKLRIIRLSFSGELAYEIYCPSHYGMAIWTHLLAVGEPWKLKVYGLEALASLRIEKGHVVGSELDGRTTAVDIGLAKMHSKKKHFWGEQLSHRSHLTQDSRPALIGLEAIDEQQPPNNGAILFFVGDEIKGVGRGHITSHCYSAMVGKTIALGFLQGGLAHENKEVIAVSPMHQREYRLKVVSPHFFDPQGERYMDKVE